jgi:hypothetical protein
MSVLLVVKNSAAARMLRNRTLPDMSFVVEDVDFVSLSSPSIKVARL